MTKADAVIAMVNGHKVAHKYFTPDEWMMIRNDGKYLFEDGCSCVPERFWEIRTEACWLTGWRILS